MINVIGNYFFASTIIAIFVEIVKFYARFSCSGETLGNGEILRDEAPHKRAGRKDEAGFIESGIFVPSTKGSVMLSCNSKGIL